MNSVKTKQPNSNRLFSIDVAWVDVVCIHQVSKPFPIFRITEMVDRLCSLHFEVNLFRSRLSPSGRIGRDNSWRIKVEIVVIVSKGWRRVTFPVDCSRICYWFPIQMAITVPTNDIGVTYKGN